MVGLTRIGQNKTMKILLNTFGLILFAATIHAQPAEHSIKTDTTDAYTFMHRAMGTDFTLLLFPREGDIGYDDLLPIATDAFNALDALERNISSWIPTSDTSRINEVAHRKPVSVGSDVFDLFLNSALIHRQTNGIFDITIGPLIELWREPLANHSRPSSEALQRTLNVIGMDRVTITQTGRSISFQKPGMRVSFGGIGKGLALDRMLPVLKTHGIKNALLSGGDSSMYAMGAPPGETFWKIGIYNPYNAKEEVEIVHLRDQALSTSACYQHLSGVTGEPCGIFDPRTGLPVENMMSATVITSTGMWSDALSTTFYIMGVDETRNYCTKHPEVHALLVPNPEDKEPKAIHIGKQVDSTDNL